MDGARKILEPDIVKLSFFKRLLIKLRLADDPERWRKREWGFEVPYEWTYADTLREWARRCEKGEIEYYTM